ncbi:MAG: protein TonB [Saprospiraceae bacterium]
MLEGVSSENDTSAKKMIESMPRFPGCEEEDLTEEERYSCSKNKMLQFIYKNLRYPYEARMQGIEGMVIVFFVILKNGDIGGAVVKGDPGGRCGNAALWIVNRMNFICDKWILGTQGGNDVKVQYTLPVKFKLEG